MGQLFGLWVDEMNKTMTMIAVVLCIITALYLVETGYDSDGVEYQTVYGESYAVISDADTRCYTDSEITYDRIYVDSASVMANAFKGCTSIQFVIFGDNVRTIGDSAFEGCTNLVYIKSTHVTAIGNYAFKGTSIGCAELSTELASIGNYAFSDCSNMMDPILSTTGVTELNEGVFANSQMKIEDLRRITSISATAFQGTTISGQVVCTGQTAKLDGVPEITIDDLDIGALKVSITSGKQYLQVVVDRYVSLVATDSNGTATVKSTMINTDPRTYACKMPFNGVDTRIGPRVTTIHFQEGLGLDDVTHASGAGTYTMPDPAIGSPMFSGWTVPGIDGRVATITEKTFQTLDTDLYPVGEFESRIITYDHNQVSGSPDCSSLPTGVSFDFGDTYQALSDISGYTFSGWMVNGAFVSAGTAITTYSDHTATSVWNSETFTVRLLNPDETVISSAPYPANHILDTSSLTAPVPSGKELTGWSLTNGGPREDSITITSDTDLYALMSDLPSFTVRYIDRGTVLSSVTGYSGSEFTISLDNPSSDGRSFQNWRLGDTDSVLYHGDSFTLTGDTDLSAVWETVKVTIRYHLDTIISASYDWGASFTVGRDDAVRSGYYLSGWSTALNGPVTYGDGTTIVASSDMDLYPCWVQNDAYRVACHDYTGRTSIWNMVDGEAFTVPEHSSRNGNSFLGWSIGRSGSIDYYPGDVFIVHEDVDLYEVWRYDGSFTVTVHGDSDIVKTNYIGLSVDVTFPTMVREGYDLIGWSTVQGSETAKYSVSQTISVEVDADYYPVWKAKGVTVTYHTDDGTKTVVCEIGAELELIDLEKEGYEFIGWRTEDSDSTVGDTITVSGDTDLYPVWEKMASDKAETVDALPKGSDDWIIPGAADTESKSDNSLIIVGAGAAAAVVLSLVAVFQMRRN